MATKDVQNHGHHNHLTLSCFPSCENCLAWSDDALALAGGSNVYLMRRKVGPNDTLIWTQDSMRIDDFATERHPEQNLSTISEFSLGEEQSDPVVVALAWSSPGLGLHSRAVLAVLTSNLLLAFWETNGSHQGWRRSCIFNSHVPLPNTSTKTSDSLPHPSRSPRIRSFVWSHPYTHPEHSRSASHFIAIVDNDNNLLFYNVAKRSKHDYGQWSIILLCATRLGPGIDRHTGNNDRLSLQRFLLQQSPLRSMSISRWQDITPENDTAKFKSRALVSFDRSYGNQISKMVFEITISGDLLPAETFNVNTATLKEMSHPEVSQTDTQHQDIRSSANILYQLNDEPKWRDALESPYSEYSNRNHLHGLVRLRFWGNAFSPVQDLEAAAVTLHPWDTYEYTPPASERCHVIFRSLEASSPVLRSRVGSEEVVLNKTLDFIVKRIGERQLKWNPLDRKIILTYYALVSSRATVDDRGGILKAILTNIEPDENGGDVVSAQQTIRADLPTETCTMCASIIEMRSPITSASCQNGHLFTRCSLSLISIQQPRISKHCSGCNRQFLDVSKLGPLESPSLAGDLFDEFDVCPYCHEKFQG